MIASPAPAGAGVLFETHSQGDREGSVSIFSGDYNDVLGNPQWLGVRFTLDAAAHVTAIGAAFDYVEGSLFGAIVALPDGLLLPTGTPFDDGEVLGYTTFSGGEPLYDLSLDLGPGVYGLVFGSGYFGTQGFSGIWAGGFDEPDDGYFFYGNQGQFPGGPRWQHAGFRGTYLTVHGELAAVPEPAVWVTLILGFALVGRAIRRSSARPRAALPSGEAHPG
ncbi:PEPxxWA-CTERM sorting domain-containing protein [Phenylobacterium sp.]|uniref:PEPxxWA-CTERM sorting domain-containing protein n=1 Tax=Phenylobacterium sp. TaxID=1871053 RepID=UPI0025CCABD7|nr:PEPxxWA-CTERM sorting domain-containing protein [Phenylobacterium sp.]